VSFRSLVSNQEVTAKPFYTPFDCGSRLRRQDSVGLNFIKHTKLISKRQYL
jgi:hypothetical protein